MNWLTMTLVVTCFVALFSALIGCAYEGRPLIASWDELCSIPHTTCSPTPLATIYVDGQRVEVIQ
jgi:hypothetical protein